MQGFLCRSARLPCRSAARLRPLCRAPARLTPACLVFSACAVSQVQWLYCNTALPISLTWSQYTKVYCDTMPLSHQPVAIHFKSCNTILPSLTAALYCNTPVCPAIQSSPPSLLLQYNLWPIYPILQYSFFSSAYRTPKGHVTIQYPLSQYNLGSSPSKFLLHFFFIILFSHLNFQLLESTIYINIYIPIFFSFSKILQ